jgi:hypothetical protein
MIESLILPSFTLGIGLVTVTWLLPRASLHNALIAVGLLLVAVMLLGIPPFPPISSKHKLIYLILLICVVAPAIPKLSLSGRMSVTALIVLVAFFWLNWRRFSVGLPSEPIWLSTLTLAIVLTGVAFADRSIRRNDNSSDSFLWPVGQFVTLLSAGFVGLLSGYLGLGQLAIGFAVFLVGILMMPYLATAFGVNNPIIKIPAGLTWVSLTTFGVLGVSLASFATNLHPIAYSLLLVTLLSPLGADRVPPMRSSLLPPIFFGVVAAIPASCAILIAFLHF